MTIERPLDLLNSLKGETVIVECKGENSIAIVGVLVAFDIHLNLVLKTEEGDKFLRGDIVETVLGKA